MKQVEEHGLLRLHLTNFERRHGQPLHEAIVGRARHEGLAGATVLAGSSGYVGAGPILGMHPGGLAVERPVIVELVDQFRVLDRFLDGLEPLLAGHAVIVTLERAGVVGRAQGQGGAPSHPS